MFIKNVSPGFHWWLSGKESNWQCRRLVFDPWSRKTPHAMEQLNLCATTREPVFRSPCFTTTEVITMRSRHTTTRELLLLSATRGKSMQQQRPSTVKKKKKKTLVWHCWKQFSTLHDYLGHSCEFIGLFSSFSLLISSSRLIHNG